MRRRLRPSCRCAAAAALALALSVAAGAAAARAPTSAERKAIVFAVRFAPTVGRQNRLTFRTIRVSTSDPGYAFVRVAVNGTTVGALLHRSGAWQVVALGTPTATCAKAPAKVRADLC